MGNSSVINILLYNGVTMSSRLGPSFAKIFMYTLEQNFLV